MTLVERHWHRPHYPVMPYKYTPVSARFGHPLPSPYPHVYSRPLLLWHLSAPPASTLALSPLECSQTQPRLLPLTIGPFRRNVRALRHSFSLYLHGSLPFRRLLHRTRHIHIPNRTRSHSHIRTHIHMVARTQHIRPGAHPDPYHRQPPTSPRSFRGCTSRISRPRRTRRRSPR
jgi:hypothetical protein